VYTSGILLRRLLKRIKSGIFILQIFWSDCLLLRNQMTCFVLTLLRQLLLWQLLLLLIWIFGKFELKPDYSVQQVDGGDSSKSLCWFLWYPRRKKTKSEPADVQYLLKLPTTQKTLYVKRYLFNSREPRKSFETHWIEKVSIDFCDPSQKKRKFEPDDVQNL